VAIVRFTSSTGETLDMAGSPLEMEDPANFYGFGFRSNDDWYTIGDSKSDIDERAVADGAFGILRDWRPALPVTVVGWYRGPDRASVRAARRKFQRVVGNGANVGVRFIDEDEDTERGLSVRSAVPTANSGLFFRVEVIGIALDPTAYGQARTYTTGLPTSGGGLVWPLGST
jgi:hypothetical protein